jgi:SAM-dependent methyltransferase
MDESDFGEASRQQWSDSAARWARAAEEEEAAGASADAAAWMLDAAGLQPGERVLELACGAGRVGLQAASLVGPGGTVLCSDFSAAMVEAVDGLIARAGMTNAAARVLDAQRLDLEEGEAFDLVLCRFGYMLMADPLQALRESGRVLRAGGRLVLAVWGSAEKNPWLSTIFDAVMAHLNAPPPEPGTPGPFALAPPDRLRETMERAGLAEVDATEIEAEQTYDSLDAWWERIGEIGGPLATLLAALPEADQTAIRDAAIADAQGFAANDGRAVFPASVIGGKARRSA